MPNLRLYNGNGLLSCHYVYSLICQDDDGPLYIKMGMSANPMQRLNEIRTGNPIQVISLAWVDVVSKQKASILESALHIGAMHWHHTLEWFKVSLSDFDDFKFACKGVLTKHSAAGRPRLSWTQADTQVIIKHNQDRSAAVYRRIKRLGAAFTDFCAAASK